MIYSSLSQLPDRFNVRPFTRQMASYVARRWRQYGRADNAIAYNPEWIPEKQKNDRFRVARKTFDRYRWVENATDGLRYIGPVHKITNTDRWYRDDSEYIPRPIIDHTGWFTNHFQDESIFGEVYMLPSRNGTPQYISAVCDACNKGASVIDFYSVTDSLRDAIYHADGMAETMAEDEREYQLEESVKNRIEEIESEIKTLYADLKTLCIELRANCDKLTGMDALKRLIRREVKRVRRQVRKLRAERLKLTNEPWTYAEGF